MGLGRIFVGFKRWFGQIRRLTRSLKGLVLANAGAKSVGKIVIMDGGPDLRMFGITRPGIAHRGIIGEVAPSGENTVAAVGAGFHLVAVGGPGHFKQKVQQSWQAGGMKTNLVPARAAQSSLLGLAVVDQELTLLLKSFHHYSPEGSAHRPDSS